MELEKLITKYKELGQYSWLVKKVTRDKELMTLVLKRTEFLDNCYESVTMTQRLYHLVFNEGVSRCQCGSVKNFKGSIKKGYYDSCPNKTCKVANTKETMKEKYGVESAMQLECFKNKQMNTLNERFGEHILSKKSTRDKRRHVLENKMLERIPGVIIARNGDNLTLKLDECGHQIEVHKQMIYNRPALGVPLCTKCYPGKDFSSYAENELTDFIQSVGFDIERRVRRFCNQEVDIFIPDKMIAVEFNGLYWHSEVFKNKDYHQKKYKDLVEEGINLIQIWEDDWNFNKNLVKHRLLAKLGMINTRINGRDCSVSVVTKKEYYEFLRCNHMQGVCASEIMLGLYHNMELVGVMGFGPTRKFMGGDKKNTELLRFCIKCGLSVRGGASKMFSFFLKNCWDGNEIISYHDCTWGKNTFYENLGFIEYKMTVPNYHYVVGRKRVHRFAYNKKKLVKQGADPNKTGREIMNEKGIPRIYGCGHQVFRYTN